MSMRKLIALLSLSITLVVAAAGTASANPDRPGAPTAPTTTVPAPTTTVPAPTTTVPAPTTTVPAPTTTTPNPATPAEEVPTPTPRPATPASVPTPVEAVPAPEPLPAAPTATTVLDCRRGIVVTVTNDGGVPATVQVIADGLPVGEITVAPGETREYDVDLDHADKQVPVAVHFNGAPIHENTIDAEGGCRDIAVNDCPVAAASTTGPSVNTEPTGCTSPCWWAPLAGLIGVALGRRRRNGAVNPAGIAAGAGFAAWFAASLGGPAAWLIAAVALLGAAALIWKKKTEPQGEVTENDTEADADVDQETDEPDDVQPIGLEVS
jgi:MYXO-CTERM domain-containing protein